jgi:lysyl-tRNA synthetase class 1
MLRTPPHRHIDFDPTGNNLPKLWDEYDRCGDAYLSARESDFAKTWSLSQVDEDHTPPGFRVRFSIVADWLQIPSVEPFREAEERKGAPLNELERRDLERRIALAKVWLERWAPPDAKFSILDALPADLSLTPEQKRFLKEVRSLIGTVTDPEAMQQELYEAAKRVWDGKAPRDAFEAIYRVFLGKPNGPKAAWLLMTLPADEVRRRLDEAAR